MKNHKRDLILIGILLLTALILFLLFKDKQRNEPDAVAVVTVDGTEIARYPLSQDGTFVLNEGSNTLVIENGEAWVSEANCPDKLCMGFGKISKNGEIIVCLPNRLIVMIEGGEASEIDAIA
ncbi:MAG: NusG domain II-containing protein [Oscillospiraceae bacterium]|nr:NusG domain II-containing protein [Oscillospiraceae bacterium]